MKIEDQRKTYSSIKFNYNFKNLIEELQLEKEKAKYYVEKFEDLQIQNETQEHGSKIILREADTDLKLDERILQGRRKEKGQGFMSRQKLHIGINKILEDLLAEEVEPQPNENIEEYYEIKVKMNNYLFFLC